MHVCLLAVLDFRLLAGGFCLGLWFELCLLCWFIVLLIDLVAGYSCFVLEFTCCGLVWLFVGLGYVVVLDWV